MVIPNSNEKNNTRVDGEPSDRTLFGLLAAWLVLLACWRPLSVPDEGRYTEVARWMWRSGDWLVPRLNGLPFLHKPPLYYWIEAAAMSIGGLSVLTARVASLLAALAVCWTAYALLRRWHGRQVARWGVVLLATNPLLVLGSQYANLDMLVAGCIALTLWAAVSAWYAPTEVAGRWWAAAWGLAGLGVLAKGLIGFVLPGAVFVVWALAQGAIRPMLGFVRPAGVALFVLVVAPWFVLAEQKVPGLTHFIIVVQHFQRYTAAGFNNAIGPWFYPALVAVSVLPWWPGMLAAVRSAWRGRTAHGLMALSWVVLIVLFFSIPRSKIAGYILPVLPGVALLMAPWAAQWRWRKVAAWCGALICVGMVWAGARWQRLDGEQLARNVSVQIAAQDEVVMWRRFDYAVPVVLDRRQAMTLVDDWSLPASALRDNWVREVQEGREFEPHSAVMLMTPQRWLQSRASHPRRSWIWVDEEAMAQEPLLRGLTEVGRAGELRLLRVEPGWTSPGLTPPGS